MRRTITIVASICLFSLFLPACKSDDRAGSTSQQKPITVSKETIKQANRHLIAKDDEIIASYMNRRQWQMEQTQSGLRYMVYKEGSGRKIQTGDKVRVRYTIELIDGTNCYDNEEETFRVGYADTRTGVHQALQLMQAGSRAKLIVPPHLAYGLIGDEKRIPARAILVYDIEVLAIL